MLQSKALAYLKGVDLSDPYLFWRALRAPFVGKASSTLGGCHTNLWSQMYTSKGIGDLCSRIETCANEIQAFGKRPSDIELVACLVRSLPAQFELTVEYVKRQCADNLEAAKIELVNREAELREKHGSSTQQHVGFVHSVSPTSRTFVKTKREKKKKSGSAMLASDGKCFNCNEPGHRVSECSNPCQYSSAHSSHEGKDCMRRKSSAKAPTSTSRRGRGGQARRGNRGGKRPTVTFAAVANQPPSLGFVGMVVPRPRKKLVIHSNNPYQALASLNSPKNSVLQNDRKLDFSEKIEIQNDHLSRISLPSNNGDVYSPPWDLQQVLEEGGGPNSLCLASRSPRK